MQQNIDIVSLVQSTGVELTQAGNDWIGYCPFHKDRNTKSLNVSPHKGVWCCFGACSKNGKQNGGDAIDWVKQKFGYNYEQARDWLAMNYEHKPHVELPQFAKPKPKPVIPDAISYWHALLDDNQRRGWFHKRGFSDGTIETQMFGWDGDRYVIPVWDWEPQHSDCLGVRRRRSELSSDDSEPKYKGLKGHNIPTVWGKWHCKGKKLILGFAGELDAARAVQDGLPAFSVVNGINAVTRFPEDWPILWFPDTQFLVVVFDKQEEVQGAKLARAWNKCKGALTARVFHWPPQVDIKDYCEWRDAGETADVFRQLVSTQIDAPRRLV